MSLPRILDGWASRDLIEGAAVLSEDGLLVHDLLNSALDGEAIAALAVTVVRHCRQLGTALGRGGFGSVVLDLDDGPAVLTPLDREHTLVIVAAADRDIGPLLFDLRQSRDVLSRSV